MAHFRFPVRISSQPLLNLAADLRPEGQPPGLSALLSMTGGDAPIRTAFATRLVLCRPWPRRVSIFRVGPPAISGTRFSCSSSHRNQKILAGFDEPSQGRSCDLAFERFCYGSFSGIPQAFVTGLFY